MSDVDPPVHVLSVCAGAGGLDRGVALALPAARTVCYVEIEAYAIEVLAQRMEEGRLDAAPLWTDLRTFDGRPWRGCVDLLVGGYPCQPFSYAGERRGANDPRHLWPHIARVIREAEPALCFFENVSGHVSLGLREVRGELEELGFAVEAGLFTAEEIGAPHRRQRVFILAHAQDGRKAVVNTDDARLSRRALLGEDSGEGSMPPSERAGGIAVADTIGGPHASGLSGASGCSVAESSLDRNRPFPPGPGDADAWRRFLEQHPGAEPAVRRDADGLGSRVDRLRLCGGGAVPDQAALAFGELWRCAVSTRASSPAARGRP